MLSTYAKAYTEILEILKYLPKEEYDKIPKSKIEFYNKNKDPNYVYEFDIRKNLNEQTISRETNSIIITLFRDYFATDVQKEKLMNILKANEVKKQRELQIKFNPNEIFKNKKSTNHIEEKINNKLPIEIKKEKFYQKIIKFIKKIFYKDMQIY